MSGQSSWEYIHAVPLPLFRMLLAPSSGEAGDLDLVKALQEAFRKEVDEPAKVQVAKAILRAWSESSEAADYLVETWTTKGKPIAEEALKAITEAMAHSPPALVAAIIPVLKHKDKGFRTKAAELLAKVNPDAIGALQYYNIRYNQVRQKSAHNAYEQSAINNVFEDVFDLVGYEILGD
jgi:hypothetical protein